MRPKSFFDSLQNYLHVSCDVILLGDFNCVVDPHLDKSGGQDREDNSSRHFAPICRDFLLVDSFRVLHPSAKLYSWCSVSSQIYCRLDRIYVSKSLCSSLHNYVYYMYNL